MSLAVTRCSVAMLPRRTTGDGWLVVGHHVIYQHGYQVLGVKGRLCDSGLCTVPYRICLSPMAKCSSTTTRTILPSCLCSLGFLSRMHGWPHCRVSAVVPVVGHRAGHALHFIPSIKVLQTLSLRD